MSSLKDRVNNLESSLKKIEELLKADDSRSPFTINSLLNLCWGLSLTLSKDENQQKTGEKFLDALLELWKRNSPENPEPTTPLTKGQQNRLDFTQNLLASIIGVVRNIGYVKDGHDRRLNELEDKYKKKVAWYEGISEISSLKQEGLIAKIASFVGGGSIVTFASNIGDLFSPSKPQFDNLEKLMNLTDNATKKAEIFNQMEILARDEGFVFSGYEISLFIASGIGLMLLVALIMSRIRDDKIEAAREAKNIKLQDYWQNNMKPEITDYVYHFYEDVSSLIDIYYKDRSEQMRKEFAKEITGDENGQLDSKVIKKYIFEDILPHYWIHTMYSEDLREILEDTTEEIEKFKKKFT